MALANRITSRLSINVYFMLRVFIVCGLLGLALSITSVYTVDYSSLSSEELFEKGQYYFNHGDSADGSYDLDKAANFYLLALEADRHPLAWYQLGRIDFLEGRNDDAIAKFRKQQELYGDLVPKTYYMLGLTYAFKALQLEDSQSWLYSEKYFIEYMRFVNYAPWPAVDLAWVYFMQSNYIAMEPLLSRALERHPDNPWVLNMYGLAMLNLEEDRGLAIPYFEHAKDQALLLTPNDWGDVYPGNDPKYWQQGRDEFIATIDKNIGIANSAI
ncbi:MAG: tetratricopeptide (TPR) repeat protein [Candidatus Paceibacteria bacterium]|jgi:tetratricopeptide (TPR) repeat protein